MDLFWRLVITGGNKDFLGENHRSDKLEFSMSIRQWTRITMQIIEKNDGKLRVANIL